MRPPPRLLIVDDQQVHRAFARAALVAAGWAVDEADGGATALHAIGARRYALILMDIQMPAPDGFAITRTIRDGGVVDHAVPIVAFTSLSGPAFEEAVRAAGMDGHIPKPIPGADLAERVSPWWPDADTPARIRLASVLGGAQLAELTDRFAEQLAEALVEIDAPGVRSRAHRIAGLAGTLGFPDVYETWLALSESEPAARDAAARAARRTLRAIGA